MTAYLRSCRFQGSCTKPFQFVVEWQTLFLGWQPDQRFARHLLQCACGYVGKWNYFSVSQKALKACWHFFTKGLKLWIHLLWELKGLFWAQNSTNCYFKNGAYNIPGKHAQKSWIAWSARKIFLFISIYGKSQLKTPFIVESKSCQV